MGAHRLPRTSVFADSPALRRSALGCGAAALSLGLLAQPAHADDDEPTEITEAREDAEAAAERAAEVKEEVDRLYREAGRATQDYHAAQERADAQQEVVDDLLDEAAEATDRVNEARHRVGQFAAAQYRHGNASDTATLLLVEQPQDFFDLRRDLDRAGEHQQGALDTFVSEQENAEATRTEAAEALEELEERRTALEERKESVQEKLGEARELLAGLNADEQAHLDDLERLEQEEAERQAAEARAEEERREQREQEERERQEEEAAESDAGSGAGDDDAESTPDPGGDADDALADEVVAFAEAQLGDPYVWGGTGPDSWDCSGLTQAAWRAAGVELPRVTYDQVDFGTRVDRDAMRPGDLVFFYEDVTHVGIYVGDGMMIHASRPGDDVKVDPISIMPFHSAVRPA